MAQLAIPILLFGTAYLISNDKDEELSNNEQEGLSNLSDVPVNGKLMNREYDKYHPNLSKSTINVNNEQDVTQHQDKYFLKKVNDETATGSQNKFTTMAGNVIIADDMNHNNMQLNYGSGKTQGIDKINTTSILDNYTGQGSYDIKKEEIATMFKPESNLNNVYGNQNQNEFLQSRVNASHRHANTKPWEEIQVAPGIGKDYNDSTSEGLNNYNEKRDMWLPKNVDELRASNNPKKEYSLDNHMGPALNPVTNMGVHGKIVKQTPDSYFENKDSGGGWGNLGMIAGTSGPKREVQSSEQMLTKENRDTTSIEYFGTRGDNNFTYVNGKYQDPHKQQLEHNPITNVVDTESNPTSSLNYGKDSYNVYSNNRVTTRTSNFGNIKSAISSITKPILNGLRHSKKTNTIRTLETTGNLGIGPKQQTMHSNEITTTTNREMYEKKLDMNHLNVQKQQESAYMNTTPILNSTQRNTMNQSEMGHASSSLPANMSYDAQYNQQNINKVHVTNHEANGNMSLFNNKLVSRVSNSENCNSRSTPFYNPTSSQYNHPSDMLGTNTSMPQNYSEISSKQIDSALLNAFKSNPYTQPLNSSI